MSIATPRVCPACPQKNPTIQHLHAHRNKGELVRVGGYVGKDYVLGWKTPAAAKKDQVA